MKVSKKGSAGLPAAAPIATAVLAAAILTATAVLAVTLVSCWAPYYDPRVSNGAAFYAKLGAPFLTIGPLSDNSGSGNPSASYEFLPSRPSADPLDPLDGFLVRRESGDLRIAFVENYQGSYRIAPNTQGSLNALGSQAFARSEAANGSLSQLITFAGGTNYSQYAFDPSTHNINSNNWPMGYNTVGIGGRLRMPIVADTDSYAIVFDTGAGYEALAGDIGIDTSSFPSLDLAPLDTGGRILETGSSAFFDAANNRFYYSQPGGTTLVWDTATWPASSGAPTALSIGVKLTAMLSDGTLIAQDDNYLSAYSSSGTRQFVTPTGSVRFEHEVYFPGSSPAAGNYMIFSQVLVVASSSGNNQIFVNAWRYPTASVAALGN